MRQICHDPASNSYNSESFHRSLSAIRSFDCSVNIQKTGLHPANMMRQYSGTHVLLPPDMYRSAQYHPLSGPPSLIRITPEVLPAPAAETTAIKTNPHTCRPPKLWRRNLPASTNHCHKSQNPVLSQRTDWLREQLLASKEPTIKNSTVVPQRTAGQKPPMPAKRLRPRMLLQNSRRQRKEKSQREAIFRAIKRLQSKQIPIKEPIAGSENKR